MYISILHLSDLHIRSDNYGKIKDKPKLIAKAIFNTTELIETLFIIVTGDIVFSGKTNEYDLFNQFKQDLENEISERKKN